MNDARLIRSVRFTASHHYGRPSWSKDRNRAVFGGQTEPHEHEWAVTVWVSGPRDPDTGFVVDLGALDAALSRVLSPLHAANLNEVIPEVRAGTLQPSTESLAAWVYERLEPLVPTPARLERVRVAESAELAGEYPAAAK